MSDELKKCPACAEDIKIEAKKCPKCQKDLRNWFVRHPIISIILIIFSISIYGNMQTTIDEIENSNNISTVKNKNITIWKKGFYNDSFGDKTKDSFIINKKKINGTFSNSATENSRLKVDFLINNKNNINIQLFEYNTKLVKEYKKVFCIIEIKDSKGKKHTLKGFNNSDRIEIIDSIKLHNLLLEEKELKFVILSGERITSEYNFKFTPTGYKEITKL